METIRQSEVRLTIIGLGYNSCSVSIGLLTLSWNKPFLFWLFATAWTLTYQKYLIFFQYSIFWSDLKGIYINVSKFNLHFFGIHWKSFFWQLICEIWFYKNTNKTQRCFLQYVSRKKIRLLISNIRNRMMENIYLNMMPKS